MFHARGVLFAVPLLVACSSKWSFEDGDGDGVSPAEGDCWDKVEGPEGTGLKGSDIGPDAEETWYDGFDQDCKGDDDYDADGDGFPEKPQVISTGYSLHIGQGGHNLSGLAVGPDGRVYWSLVTVGSDKKCASEPGSMQQRDAAFNGAFAAALLLTTTASIWAYGAGNR